MLECSGEEMSFLISYADPTMHIFKIVEKNERNLTVKDFQTAMEKLDRWDVIDDTETMFGIIKRIYTDTFLVSMIV